MTYTATIPTTSLLTNEIKITDKIRVQSIDLLRGLVMVIMALDHVRDFFHADALINDPLDFNTTTPLLFFTRWITHFCAPTFVLLSGISAYISGSWGKTKNELAVFLLSRGLWLIVLELTIISLGWSFDIKFRVQFLQVIWAIGLSMVMMSGAIYLPRAIILFLAILIIAGHNLFDAVHATPGTAVQFIWSVLHEFGFFKLSKNATLIVAYPVLPWFGLMALGYCFGKFYTDGFQVDRRKKILLYTGLGMVLLFILLRLTNIYGDAASFQMQPVWYKSIYSFLKTTKYPPSLQYTLMTIGPALIFLRFAENWQNKLTTFFITIGRVPLFYYVLHIYLIHATAVLAALAVGFTLDDFVFSESFASMPVGSGFSLGVVYLFWMGIVLVLYFPCRWFAAYKARHKNNRLLSYL